MPTFAYKGARISYRDEGKGPVVVLLHASSSASGQWRGLIAELARDHRVIAIDRQGYGASAAPCGSINHLIAHEAAMVGALIEWTGGPVHLVGHSSGGVVAVRAALAAGAPVASLTLIEPVLLHLAGRDEAGIGELHRLAEHVIGTDDAGLPGCSARRFIDYWSGAGSWQRLPAQQREYIEAGMSRVAREFRCMRRAMWPAATNLKRLAVPVMLLQGSDTTTAAAAIMEKLRATLPRATSATIGGAGHMSPLTHAGAINPFIAGFIRNNGVAPAKAAA